MGQAWTRSTCASCARCTTDRELANPIPAAYEDRQVFHYVPSTESLGNLDILCLARTPGEIEWIDGEIDARVEATAPG